MSDRVKVTHKLTHLFGTSLSGPSGRIYYIHPTTGALHLTQGDKFSKNVGVLPEDAAEYQQFPKLFDVEGSERRTPPRRARPTPPPPKAEAEPEETDEEDEEPEQPPVQEIATLELPEEGLPEDLPSDGESIANWIDYARDVAGIDLSATEKRLNKTQLINLIKNRLRESGEE